MFENVEGLLSYEKGKTYKEILQLFSELGYNCLGRLLNASDYAVPQRRKRVIIICTKKDLPYKPENLFPQELTKDESAKITAFQAIGDLEKIPCDEDFSYNSENQSDFVKTLKGQIAYSIFLQSVAKNFEAEENQPELF